MPDRRHRLPSLAACWIALAGASVPGLAAAADPSHGAAHAAAPGPGGAASQAAAAPAPAAAATTVAPPTDVPPTLGTVALPPRPARPLASEVSPRPAADAPVRPAAAQPPAAPAASAASAASAAQASAERPAPPASAPAATAVPAAADPARARAPSADALEYVRQRLKERLNAQPAKPSATPYDLRVANRSPLERGVAGPGGPAGRGKGREEPHWSYEGETGPDAWASLKPAFAACARGERQSPIDIRDGIPVQAEPIRFDYRPGAFRVIDNGHTVQVNVAAGNAIEVRGRRYLLRQFHFHRPAEERIDGRAFDMNVHLVHQDGEGRLAVIAVLLERGSALPVVQAVWNNLPLEKHQEHAALHPLDPTELLPEDRRYHTYMGSLTTPPCTEGVLWMVMQQPVQVSAQQIDIFSRLYPMNARPIQETAGRLIKSPE